MLPVRDINPTRRLPIVTWGLIAINVVVFLWELSLSESQLTNVFRTLSVVPALASANPLSVETFLDVLRNMFFHGGWEHILGNMLYLFLFGDNIEDRFGIPLYLVIYFVSGFVAAFAQVIIDPGSSIPLVGASGAIAGILGSYLILYPNVRVLALIPLGYLSSLREVPALIVLGLWFVLQLVSGFGSLGAAEYGGGVAFFAHIGGFIAGVVLTLILNGMTHQPPASERVHQVEDRAMRRIQRYN
ncbi:MAG: rhomboid family intramembrane serine protease [bacterium]|nr:rhomboid family intramembrane serine protease [bacterium]